MEQEQIGKTSPILQLRYKDILKMHGLVDKDQLLDFSSTYLVGENTQQSQECRGRAHPSHNKSLRYF
jgi:hypothetical protein